MSGRQRWRRQLLAALAAAAVHAALLLLARLAPGAAPGRLADPRAVAFLLPWLAWSAAEAALTRVDGGVRGAGPARPDRLLALATGAGLLAGAWHGLWAAPRFTLGLAGTCLAAAGLGAGIVLRLRAVRALGPRFVTAVRVEQGAPLVTGGPFARVRHPSETGLLAAALGGALLLGSWPFLALWAGLLLPLSIARARREDRVLAAAHGGAFEAQRRRTGLLLPRPRQGRPSPR